MDNDTLKKNDQINLLERCLEYTETGKYKGAFSYPNCGYDLVRQGFATEDKKITVSGRALLWHLGKGTDPTNTKAVHEHEVNL